MRQWFRFENKADDPTSADVYIYDEIGASFWNDQAVTAKDFIADLAALSAAVTTIRVHVSSLGGDPFDATAIANALRDQRRSHGRTVITIIESIAASAASIVTCAGDPIRISDNGLMMIHEPHALAIGTADEHRAMGDALDRVRDAIIATYRWVSTKTVEELGALMKAETWFDADAAIAAGFATEKVEGLQVAASLEPRALARLTLPERYRGRVAALVKPAPLPSPAARPAAAVDVLRLCREGDCLDLAEVLIVGNTPLVDVQARVTEARTTRTAAAQRATDIRALCKFAGLAELADGYIAGGITPDAICAHLVFLIAKIDNVEIDGSLMPDGAARASRGALNTAAIYAARNARPLPPAGGVA